MTWGKKYRKFPFRAKSIHPLPHLRLRLHLRSTCYMNIFVGFSFVCFHVSDYHNVNDDEQYTQNCPGSTKFMIFHTKNDINIFRLKSEWLCVLQADLIVVNIMLNSFSVTLTINEKAQQMCIKHKMILNSMSHCYTFSRVY